MLKLKRFQGGQWFPYPEHEGVRFLIKPLHLSQGLEIRSKVRSAVAVDVPQPGGKKGTVASLMEDVDSGRFTWEIFDFILQDFEGIQVMDEKDVELIIPKNELKKAIFDDSELREFIMEKSEWLREQGDRKLGAEIKN